jgi:acetyltransferase-like isoleucine patch superfamily enzyme
MDDDLHVVSGQTNTTGLIVIGNNVLVCPRSIILQGVKIGNGAIIAAGAVASKNVLSNAIVGGNPAKILRKNIKWM